MLGILNSTRNMPFDTHHKLNISGRVLEHCFERAIPIKTKANQIHCMKRTGYGFIAAVMLQPYKQIHSQELVNSSNHNC